MEISPLHAAVAGLTAQEVRLSVAANNIANLNTFSFKRNLAVTEEGADGLPKTNVTRSTDPGPLVANPEGLPGGNKILELSNVDLATEFIQMKLAETGYRANASVIRNQDEIIGTIINILA